MAFASWLGMESAEDKRKKAQEFEKKILPFGIEQKEAIFSCLRPLMHKRVADSELMFAFFVSKQKYLEDKDDKILHVQKWLKRRLIFSKPEKEYILALVLLDVALTSLEEYPNSEDIKNFLGRRDSIENDHSVVWRKSR